MAAVVIPFPRRESAPSAAEPRCGECLLARIRDGGPVPSEWPANPRALLVGEAPGAEEIKEGRPFVGRAGQELFADLASVGIRRSDVAIANALSCRPPENALQRALHQLQKENKKRTAEGLPANPSPLDCCRPRLLAEIARLPKVIALGSTALDAILCRHESIMEVRGGPRRLAVGGAGAVELVPTLHPAFVARSKRWRGAFVADLARAFRFFAGTLAWREPDVLFIPTPDALEEWLELAKRAPYTVYDVETFAGFPAADHFDPLFDKLKCIGIGLPFAPKGPRGEPRPQAVVVPFRSIEPGGPRFYTSVDRPRIVALLRRYLTDPAWKKGGWNEGYYDRLVCESQLGVRPTPILDGLGLHRYAEPELPHTLAYAGSVHTDVSSWKAGHVATTAETDRQLWAYCAVDTVVTGLAIPRVAAGVRARNQEAQARLFPELQDICVGLHRGGLYVDQERRREWDRQLVAEAKEHREKCKALAQDRDLNPGSTQQLGTLLFDRWGVLPHHYTELAEPSTDDDALRAFLSPKWSLSEEKRAFVQTVRAYRKATKLRGTYILRLRPISEVYVPEPELAEEEEEEEARTEEQQSERKRQRKARRARDRGLAKPACGLVLPDGRVHADYLPHGTLGWRFSSSKPNLQNIPVKLRDLFVAPPGRCFVGCDEAQLELRMVAGLAKIAYYLEAFARGEDPHFQLCVDFFKGDFTSASATHRKLLRKFVKEFTYASLYRAKDETKHEVLTSSEDEKGKLLYPWLTLRQTAAFSEAWLRRCSEIEKWWESDVAEWRRQGFLAEPILGLTCDFLDGESEDSREGGGERDKRHLKNRLANFKSQAGGAGLVHLATFDFLKEVPFGRWGPGTGLVQQGHDSLLAEVPMDHPPVKVEVDEKGEQKITWCESTACRCTANRTARLLEECMAMDGNRWSLPVKFLGEAKIGFNWQQT
jgi:uracil-DNA glycosylase family 4